MADGMKVGSSHVLVDDKADGLSLGIWLGDKVRTLLEKVDGVEVGSLLGALECKADGLSLGIQLW